jgi:hypothetical protein
LIARLRAKPIQQEQNFFLPYFSTINQQNIFRPLVAALEIPFSL